jgi:imidazolonepropionase-like amidohydrolase
MRLAALLLLAASGFAADAESVLIKNVTIHPITSPEIKGGSVLVVDGKIAAVGVNVTSKGARVFDGKGLHLYPGLINAGTNVGLAEISSIRDTVDLDEIGVFNPQLKAEIAFNPSSEHVQIVRAAGITTVLSLPSSGGAEFGA